MTYIEDLLIRIENSSSRDDPVKLRALLGQCMLYFQMLRDGSITFDTEMTDRSDLDPISHWTDDANR